MFEIISDEFLSAGILVISYKNKQLAVRNPNCNTKEELQAFISDTVIPELIANEHAIN